MYITNLTQDEIDAFSILNEEPMTELDFMFDERTPITGATEEQTQEYYKSLEKEGIIKKLDMQ